MHGKPEPSIPPHAPGLTAALQRQLQQWCAAGATDLALQEIHRHLQQPEDAATQVLLKYWQATVLHQQLRSAEALEVLNEATPEAADLQDPRVLHLLTHKTIEVLQGMKQFEAAREREWALLRMQSEHGNLDWEMLLDVCATQIVDSSLDIFLQTLPGHLQLPPGQEALLYKDLGNVMCSLKRYPEGLRLFTLGLEVLPPDAPTAHRVDLLNGVGGVYTWTERFREALAAYQENHRLLAHAGDLHGELQQMLNIAGTLQSIPRVREARATLQQVIARASELGLWPFVRQAHYMMTGLKGLPRKEAALHLLEYARLEVQLSEDPGHLHEPLLLHMEVRQNQQNFDFQKSMRLELEGAYQKLYDLNDERQQLYERLEQQASEFERLANTDPLTGLPNRRLFFAQLEREYARVKRSRADFSVVLMDIDHFKSINDTFSHKTGDLVLKIVADLLRLDRRNSDLVARYGGEEFVLLLPGAGALGARQACERLQKRLASYPWSRLLGERTVTMSYGICADPTLDTMDQVLMKADEHLYQAKRAGRNCIVG